MIATIEKQQKECMEFWKDLVESCERNTNKDFE